MNANVLKREIEDAMMQQGYELHDGRFRLLSQFCEQSHEQSRKALRKVHELAKKERVGKQKQFLQKHRELIRSKTIDGAKLNVSKISPRLVAVKPCSEEEILYRWWNHIWWSLPYEKAFGRQMRYIVWDEYHNAVLGLIGLQSPILSWAPRDQELGIARDEKDYWINQSMSIQRLGALPPYNYILGGKLVAMLATSDTIRKDFNKKYADRLTEMKCREIPAHLLFATTTGAFGKSSIYNRLRDSSGKSLVRHIGSSKGSGSFHIPNTLYLKLLEFLSQKGVNIARGYGYGPSRKMRLINQSMRMLGYEAGNMHGIPRAIYLLSYVANLNELISGKDLRPCWHQRIEKDLAIYWKERWALPRIDKKHQALSEFKADVFIEESLMDI